MEILTNEIVLPLKLYEFFQFNVQGILQ